MARSKANGAPAPKVKDAAHRLLDRFVESVGGIREAAYALLPTWSRSEVEKMIDGGPIPDAVIDLVSRELAAKEKPAASEPEPVAAKPAPVTPEQLHKMERELAGYRAKRFTMPLPTRLTERERLARADELALRLDQLEGVKANAKQIAATFKEDISKREKRVAELGRVVRSGEEERLVECYERIYGDSVETIRVDTGEVVEKRAATADDRQVDMFGGLPSRSANGHAAHASGGVS